MPKTNQIILSSNGGELGPLMDQRIDQEKHKFGCRTMENFFPLIYGSSQSRPGLEYIAAQKSSSARGRVVPFEHSVDDAYILLFENQVIRVFKDGTQVLDSVGTEDISGLDNIIAHWLLNDNEAVTTVLDNDGNTHDGISSIATENLATTGKVNSCFDLDGQYDVTVSDHNDFSFTDNANDSAFSIACWAYIEKQKGLQVLLSKWRDTSTTQEWRLSVDENRKLQLHLSDSSGNLEGNRVAQWKLDEDAANKTVLDDTANNHDGLTQTSNTEDLTETGKVNAAINFAKVGDDAVVITNDHNDLSFGDGANDSAFSIAAWIYVGSGLISRGILTKYNVDAGSEAREWRLALRANTNQLIFGVYDESANANRSQRTTSNLSAGWHFVVATYNGVGGNSAEDGITLYVDGASVSMNSITSGTYVAMENLTTKVVIGAYTDGAGLKNYYQDKLDNIILFDIELTTANIATLWNDGNGIANTSSITVNAKADTALTEGWHFLASTMSTHATRATPADDIILYVDGAAVSSTATNDANWTAMQNGAEEVRIGSQRNSGDAANENFWADKIDEVSIYSDVLTPTEVASLYSTTPYEVTTPYLTVDIPYLKFEHSADVKFITHPSYEPRRLSRTGDVLWTLAVEDMQTGPFRDENTTLTKTIVASATTGAVTLTAVGHTPFYTGTTAGHEPSGSVATSKSQTGALFKLIQATSTNHIAGLLDPTGANTSATLAISKGVTWDLVTNGTWGQAADSATIVLERSYDSETTYETIVSFTSAANYNIKTDSTEDFADALYRLRVTETTAGGAACAFNLSLRDTSHIGIVEITSVTSPTVAIGTVLKTLASTDLTHRWSEGSFSNYRGWPIDVAISAEERLTFVGQTSKPLTVYGSESGNFTNFLKGTNDNDPMNHTLIGTGQQNRIRWILAKDVLIIGTVGGEHIFGASKDDEALTPSNVRARIQTTKGSEDIAAIIVGQAVLFAERGGKKIRELLYDYQSDSHKSDDLTVFANHIMGTGDTDGVVDMAYQRTPDPMLWCVRNDGQMAVMSYERDQKVFAWSRLVTADGTADSSFESVAVIYGGARSEDEVWVTVKRTINDNTARYVERFKPRNWGSDDEDIFFVDSGATYDSISTTAMTGATHLVGETVAICADGVKQDSKVVSATGTFTLDTAASKVHYGLAYTPEYKPMKLNLFNLGLATTKKVQSGVLSFYKTKGGKWGADTDKMNPIVFRDAGGTGVEFPMFTGDRQMPFRGGWDRSGDIIIQQPDPYPMTIVAMTLEVGAAND